MQDDIRIGNERKFWSENASEYDYSIIENHWKMYPSLLDKNLRRSWRWGCCAGGCHRHGHGCAEGGVWRQIRVSCYRYLAVDDRLASGAANRNPEDVILVWKSFAFIRIPVQNLIFLGYIVYLPKYYICEVG